MAIEGTVSETRGGKRKVMGRMVRSKVDPVVLGFLPDRGKVTEDGKKKESGKSRIFYEPQVDDKPSRSGRGFTFCYFGFICQKTKKKVKFIERE